MGKVIRVYTAALSGIEAQSVEVEVRSAQRSESKAFIIVGLGDNAVKESKERVRSALYGVGCDVPGYIIVNLAPAEIKKEGSSFDLAIAVGLMISSGAVPYKKEFSSISVHGELGLDGKIRSVRGVAAKALEAKLKKRSLFIVPKENIEEARVVCPDIVVGVQHLFELKQILSGEKAPIVESPTPSPGLTKSHDNNKNFSDVIGQEQAKRAFIIAAAGMHNIIMVGPPGCGKSMLAERLPSILPPLSDGEMLEVVQIHSALGAPLTELLTGKRPFRAPHHTISDVGLLGGGSSPRPGEISYAHRGVLFMDEFPEYRRSALEGMRTPLESGTVHIARSKGVHIFPGRFQLVAAMNPCPCGRLGMKENPCSCFRSGIASYLHRLSGPILDRIDMQVEIKAVPLDKLTEERVTQEDDYKIQEIVAKARQFQLARSGVLNCELSLKQLFTRGMGFSAAMQKLIEHTAMKKKYSARGFVRIARVARTIADLETRSDIEAKDVTEAFSYRSLDRIREYATAVG